MDHSHRPFCTYAVSQSGKDVVSVAGTIWPTRAETISYLKAKSRLAHLSTVDDGRFSFTIGGDDVDDEEGLWANSVDDLPVKPKPIIYLDISDEPVKVKAESDVNAKTVDLLVYFEYRSPAGHELNSYERTVQPAQQIRGVFAGAASNFGRDAGELVFRLDGRVLQGDGTCAKEGVFAGARIIATDKDGPSPVNAAAGSSTGPGTRHSTRPLSVGEAARAADDSDAPHPPRPSAPTKNSSADQRPVSGPPARQHSPAASSSANVSTPSTAQLNPGRADQRTNSTPSASDQPSAPSISVAGQKRASGDVDASDGNAGGILPKHDDQPTKKTAKVVKEKPTKPAAGQKRKMSAGEQAYKPASASKMRKGQGGTGKGDAGLQAVVDAHVSDSDIVEDGPAQPQPSVKNATGSTFASAQKRHRPPGTRPRSTAAQSTSSLKKAAVAPDGPATTRQAPVSADEDATWQSSLPTPACSPTSPGRSCNSADEQREDSAVPPPPAHKNAATSQKTVAANGDGKGEVKKCALAQGDDDDAPPSPARDVFDADEAEGDDRLVVQAGSSKKKKKLKPVVDSDDDGDEAPISSPENWSIKTTRTKSSRGQASNVGSCSERGRVNHPTQDAQDGDGVAADDRLVRMYICPPRPMDLVRKVLVAKEWGICIDEIADKTTDLVSGRTSAIRRSRMADWTPTGWRFTELNLKPRLSLPLPGDPLPPGDVVLIEKDPAPFDYPSTVLLTREESHAYLRKTLLALGVPNWQLGTLPIRPVQHSHKPVFTHILLRFVPQAAYVAAVKIELDPPAEVETRLFYIYRGLTAKQAADAKWDGIRGRAEEDVRGWRDILEVPAEEEQNDASLMRLCECGGMEIIGR